MSRRPNEIILSLIYSETVGVYSMTHAGLETAKLHSANVGVDVLALVTIRSACDADNQRQQ